MKKALEEKNIIMPTITEHMRKGKLQDTNYKFITFGGDGGTYDIGIQSLS